VTKRDHLIALNVPWSKCSDSRLTTVVILVRYDMVSRPHYYYYYVKVTCTCMFAHSYNENSHERANENNML